MPNKKYPVIFRNRDIARIWTGQVFSQVGTALYQIAFLWWLATSSGSRGVTGFLIASTLPALLFVKLAGKTVDNTSRKTVLVGADLGAFAAIAVGLALISSGKFSPAGGIVVGFFVATAMAFFEPALNRTISEVASPEDMEEAVSFQASTRGIASLVGAVLGAMLVDRLGLAGICRVYAACLLLSVLANFGISLKWRLAAVNSELSGAEATGWKILDETPLLKEN